MDKSQALRIQDRHESEKWRVYRKGWYWITAAPASIYNAWLDAGAMAGEEPDRHWLLEDHHLAIAYADRMVRDG